MPVGRFTLPTDGWAAPALTVPLTRNASPAAGSPIGGSGGAGAGPPPRPAAILAAAAADAAAAAACAGFAGPPGATPARWNPPAAGGAAPPARPSARGGAARLVRSWGGVGGGIGTPLVISANGSIANCHCAAAAPGATLTSRRCGDSPIISTWMFQLPSAIPANRYAPWLSVVVTSELLPWVAVTRAPGTGTPFGNVTRPTWSPANTGRASRTSRRAVLIFIGLAHAFDDEHVHHFFLSIQLEAEVADRSTQ